MTEITLTSELLTVRVQGMDRWLAFKSQLDIPLKHLTGAEATPLDEREWASWSALRTAGTTLPGIIRAGSFLQHGEWVFWDVRHPEKALAIHLAAEHYAKLVIEVEDPIAAASAIQAAIHQ